LGNVPELDPWTVHELVGAHDGRFTPVIDANDLTAEAYTTLATLADFVGSEWA
jgi:hypothetical protein